MPTIPPELETVSEISDGLQQAVEEVQRRLATANAVPESTVAPLLEANRQLSHITRQIQRSFDLTSEQPSFGPPVTVIGPTSPGIEPQSFSSRRIMSAPEVAEYARGVEDAARQRMAALEEIMAAGIPISQTAVISSAGLPPGRITELSGGMTPSSIRETLAREADLDRELRQLGIDPTGRAPSHLPANGRSPEYLPGIMPAVHIPMQVTYPLASDELSVHTVSIEMPVAQPHNLITHNELSRVNSWETLKGTYVRHRRTEQASGLELLDHSPFYGTYMTKTYKKFYNTLMLLRSIGPRDNSILSENRPCTFSTYSSLVFNETLHGVVRHDTIYTNAINGNSDNRIILSENAAKFLFGNNVTKAVIKECLEFFESTSAIDLSFFVEKVQTNNTYYAINLSGPATSLFSSRTSDYYLGDSTSHLYCLADGNVTLHADTLDTYNSIIEMRNNALPAQMEEDFRNELYETSFASPVIREPHLLSFYTDRYVGSDRNFDERSGRVAPRTNSGYSRTSMPTAINDHEQNWQNERRALQRLREEESDSSRNQNSVDSYHILAYIQNAYRYAENITRLDRTVQQTAEVIAQNFCQRVYNTWTNNVARSLTAGLENLDLNSFTRNGFHFYNDSNERAYCFRLKRESLEQTMVVGNRGPLRNRTRINREINARIGHINQMLGTFGGRLTSRLHNVVRDNGETKQIRLFILEGMPQHGERYTTGVNPIAERLRLEQTTREDSIAMPAWFTELSDAIPIANFISVDEVQDIRPLESNQWTVVQLPQEVQTTYHAAAEAIRQSSEISLQPSAEPLLASVQDYAVNLLAAMESTHLATGYLAAAVAGQRTRR